MNEKIYGYDGWLSKQERELLYGLGMSAKVIVNVGVEFGASVHILHDANPQAKLYAIDLDNTKFVGDKTGVYFMTGNSNTIDFAEKADLIFIDGGHDHNTVKGDIAKFAPLCTQYLLFHDYSDAEMHAGVKQTLDEWDTKDFAFVQQVDTIRMYKRL